MSHASSRRQLAATMHEILLTPSLAPQQDTLERALWRIQTVLDGFYDEGNRREPPYQGPTDLLTDLMHLCDERGISIHECFSKAQWMFDEEQKEWADVPPNRLGGESPNTDSRAGSGEF